MLEAVFAFGEIFGNEALGHVALVAGGRRVVAGLLPSVVWIAHDMAVRAGFRLAAQIGEPLAFAKGVCARPQERAEQAAREGAQPGVQRIPLHNALALLIVSAFPSATRAAASCETPSNTNVAGTGAERKFLSSTKRRFMDLSLRAASAGTLWGEGQ
mgnify:CR=1 FL=1